MQKGTQINCVWLSDWNSLTEKNQICIWPGIQRTFFCKIWQHLITHETEVSSDFETAQTFDKEI